MKSFNYTENGVSLVLSNVGTAPGFVRFCKFDLVRDGKVIQEFNTNLDPRSATRLVKGEDIAEVFFRIEKYFFRDIVNANSGDKSESLKDGTLKLHLKVEIMQYDGSSTNQSWETPAKDLFHNIEY